MLTAKQKLIRDRTMSSEAQDLIDELEGDRHTLSSRLGEARADIQRWSRTVDKQAIRIEELEARKANLRASLVASQPIIMPGGKITQLDPFQELTARDVEEKLREVIDVINEARDLAT